MVKLLLVVSGGAIPRVTCDKLMHLDTYVSDSNGAGYSFATVDSWTVQISLLMQTVPLQDLVQLVDLRGTNATAGSITPIIELAW